MKECYISNKALNIFLIIYILIVLTLLYLTPFTHTEANILFLNKFTLETFIVKFFYNYFHKAWLLRLPFFLISVATLFLYKEIIKEYFQKNSSYYNLAIVVFLLTPGVFLSFIIVSYATIPIFLTLLLVYSYNKDNKFLIILSLMLLFFTYNAQFIIYIALIIYAYIKKKYWLSFVYFLFLIFSSLVKTYPIDGVPKGHLIQLFGIYSAIFSPLYFLAVVYSMYRVAIDKKQDLLWYISTTAFVISIILSIRQKIKITDFAPYIVIIAPIVVLVFKNSISIRLKEFRKRYYIVCNIILGVLLLETLTISIHYPLYKINPKSKLIIDKSIYTIPKIATKLKSEKKSCKNNISTREKMLYQYYKIAPCN